MNEVVGAAWPHVRAWLVAAHIFAVVGMALPSPGGGMNKGAWKEPTVQAEFAAWRGRLEALGYVTTPEIFEERLWVVAKAAMSGRDKILAPFDPYYQYCGTYQSWRMFVAPHTFPSRMHVDVLVSGIWKPVYVERSGEYQWLAWQLDQDRFRSAVFRFSWKQYRKQYREFANWLAMQAGRDFPEATKVRVRFWKAPSATPEQARAGVVPEGAWVFEEVRVIERLAE